MSLPSVSQLLEANSHDVRSYSPPGATGSEQESLEDLAPSDCTDRPHPFQTHKSLSKDDVRADPILVRLAKQQGALPPSPVTTFKAKPAPANMGDKGVGPRMSKAATLRMGLAWDKDKKEGEKKVVDFGRTPGHKRANLSLDITSLSRPTLAVRQNKTSQLRNGGPSAPPIVRRTTEEVLADNRAKAEEEKLKRRQSTALPASLSAPTIAPRMNRTSMMRTPGVAKPPPTSFDRYLTSTSAANVPPKIPATTSQADVKTERRKSMMGTIKSLGAPSIAPRLNKTALLRTPHSASTATTPGVPFSRPPVSATNNTTTHTRRPSTAAAGTIPRAPSAPLSRIASRTAAPSAPAFEPRPTKASLLRAKLGSKVQGERV